MYQLAALCTAWHISTLLHYTKQLTFIECFRNEVVKKGKKLRNFKVYRTEIVYLCYRN